MSAAIASALVHPLKFVDHSLGISTSSCLTSIDVNLNILSYPAPLSLFRFCPNLIN